MKSYEINISCDTDDCDSIETSGEPDALADAEEQIQRNCEVDGWEIQGEVAVCPHCINKTADYPECSGDPADCPENEGYGCCKPNPKL